MNTMQVIFACAGILAFVAFLFVLWWVLGFAIELYDYLHSQNELRRRK